MGSGIATAMRPKCDSAVVARLARRALLLFIGYVAILAAVVVAGFLGGALGIWASILWGVGIVTGLAVYVRRRLERSESG